MQMLFIDQLCTCHDVHEKIIPVQLDLPHRTIRFEGIDSVMVQYIYQFALLGQGYWVPAKPRTLLQYSVS